MPLVTRTADSGNLKVSATQPTLIQGDLWYDTTNDIIYSFDGSNIVLIGIHAAVALG